MAIDKLAKWEKQMKFKCKETSSGFGVLCMHHRVHAGHGKPGKSWNFRISFPRSFCKENGKNVPKTKDDFQENGQI